jgi:hypothetical protein
MKAKVGDEKGGSEESEVRGLERRRGIFVLIERKSAIFLVLGVSCLRCWHFCVVLLDKESELYLGLLSPREKDRKENLHTSFETFSHGPLFFSFQFG